MRDASGPALSLGRTAAGRAQPVSDPRRRRRSRPCPSNGALSASSIFIASSTPSRCPSSTASPSATSTASTVPGIGAVSGSLAGSRGRVPVKGSGRSKTKCWPGRRPPRRGGRRSPRPVTRGRRPRGDTTCRSAENCVHRAPRRPGRGPGRRWTTRSQLDAGSGDGAGASRKPSAAERPWSPWSAASIAGHPGGDVRASSGVRGGDLGASSHAVSMVAVAELVRGERAPAGTRRWW